MRAFIHPFIHTHACVRPRLSLLSVCAVHLPPHLIWRVGRATMAIGKLEGRLDSSEAVPGKPKPAKDIMDRCKQHDVILSLCRRRTVIDVVNRWLVVVQTSSGGLGHVPHITDDFLAWEFRTLEWFFSLRQ